MRSVFQQFLFCNVGEAISLFLGSFQSFNQRGYQLKSHSYQPNSINLFSGMIQSKTDLTKFTYAIVTHVLTTKNS